MPMILVCAATEIEARHLSPMGAVGGGSFETLVTGVGPVNAALSLTQRLARQEAAAVISFGIGGAYPNSGLSIGEVVCAESEYYADLGADSPDGFLDMNALGFPVVGDHFNHLPLGLWPTARRRPFVTRSTCTGRLQDALVIEDRTGGAVESMEGAAIVHVALAHGIPVGEVRGISNSVGDRDPAGWRIDEAARAAARALGDWVTEVGVPCG